MEKDTVRKAIQEHYEALADQRETVLGGAAEVSRSIGYSAQELAAVPEEANLGLGCGNPQEAAKPQPGESVLDLGSGRGLDCFLASLAVGPQGRVYGVDSSPTMVDKANAIAAKKGFTNCEFVFGEIEQVPLPDQLVDLVISNCVINLSDDKEAVYREVFRMLKPGGRVAVSDITAKKELPAAWLDDPDMRKT